MPVRGEKSSGSKTTQKFSEATRKDEKEVGLTAIADTRLLLTLEFPPDKDTKRQVEAAMTHELTRRLLAPTIVLTEFLKIAGIRIGEETARLRLRLLKERGLHTLPLSEEMALL